MVMKMSNSALKEEIAEYVERLVLEEGDDYLSALLDACDQFHLDFNQLAKLLSPALKAKLETEASSNGLLKGGSKPMVTF